MCLPAHFLAILALLFAAAAPGQPCASTLFKGQLRYEVLHTSKVTESEERLWVLRWYLQEEFRQLLLKAGFARVVAVRENGKPAKESDPAFVFIASR